MSRTDAQNGVEIIFNDRTITFAAISCDTTTIKLLKTSTSKQLSIITNFVSRLNSHYQTACLFPVKIEKIRFVLL
jgi:hypothetical protein